MISRLPIWIIVIVTVVVLILVLAYFGFGFVGGQLAAGATATAQASSAMTAQAVANATSTASAGQTNCGEVSNSPDASGGALDSATCFQFAFESCRPAQLTLTRADVGTKQTFTTGKQGTRCYVLLTTSFTDSSKGAAPAPIQCTGEFLKNDGLHISGCGGNQEIVIPAQQP